MIENFMNPFPLAAGVHAYAHDGFCVKLGANLPLGQARASSEWTSGAVSPRSLPIPYRTGIFARSKAFVSGEASHLSLPLTIPAVLAAAAKATPDAIAIENEDGSKLTFAE